jgi:hypothetical protein
MTPASMSPAVPCALLTGFKSIAIPQAWVESLLPVRCGRNEKHPPNVVILSCMPSACTAEIPRQTSPPAVCGSSSDSRGSPDPRKDSAEKADQSSSGNPPATSDQGFHPPGYIPEYFQTSPQFAPLHSAPSNQSQRRVEKHSRPRPNALLWVIILS